MAQRVIRKELNVIPIQNQRPAYSALLREFSRSRLKLTINKIKKEVYMPKKKETLHTDSDMDVTLAGKLEDNPDTPVASSIPQTDLASDTSDRKSVV